MWRLSSTISVAHRQWKSTAGKIWKWIAPLMKRRASGHRRGLRLVLRRKAHVVLRWSFKLTPSKPTVP